MLMKVALNSSDQLVSIGQVERGLACQCFCFECGESVIAKKGEINEHHFAHASNKESCHIHPESILHKYAKEVIIAEQKIYLPELSYDGNQQGKLYQFHTIQPEQSVGDIRPDLIAINDDEMVFIEIAVTSFIDDEKRDFINKLGVKTIEIDLSVFLNTGIEIPSDFVKNYILNHLDNKTWIYPKEQIIANNPLSNNLSIQNFSTNLKESSIMSNNPVFIVVGLHKSKGTFNNYGRSIDYDNLVITAIRPFTDYQIREGAIGHTFEQFKIKGSENFSLYRDIKLPCEAEFVFEADFSSGRIKSKLTQLIFKES
ncbi:MAG: competence protein CoiA family protein [Moraxella sp.]|uniref:competence protein CoiA family protein n=1 Tax=Moraxella sp. TaxID=479 RepID=UPI0026DBDD73|nr:competence protein CoiA family protein [Moraxella sp.]MDO4450352.1 competence protein CoiA family protein [Moraxella sp.]